MQLSDIQLAQVAAGAGFTGDALVTAIAVALAESSGIVGNVGDGNTSFGLWQVHTPAHPQYSRASLLNDAGYNAAAAYDISSGGSNWYPWSTWKNGAYRKYLARARNAAASTGYAGYSDPGSPAPDSSDGVYTFSDNQSDLGFDLNAYEGIGLSSPIVIAVLALGVFLLLRR